MITRNLCISHEVNIRAAVGTRVCRTLNSCVGGACVCICLHICKPETVLSDSACNDFSHNLHFQECNMKLAACIPAERLSIKLIPCPDSCRPKGVSADHVLPLQEEKRKGIDCCVAGKAWVIPDLHFHFGFCRPSQAPGSRCPIHSVFAPLHSIHPQSVGRDQCYLLNTQPTLASLLFRELSMCALHSRLY